MGFPTAWGLHDSPRMVRKVVWAPIILMQLKLTPALPELAPISGSISPGILRVPARLPRALNIAGPERISRVRYKLVRPHRDSRSAPGSCRPQDNAGPTR